MWSGSCLPETWSSFAWITLRSCTLIPAWNEAVFFPLLNLVVGITGHPFQIFSSVTQSCLTLKPHGLQHTRLPCPSPALGALLKLMSMKSVCHPAISFSVVPFSSCLQSFPASGSFPMSQFFASGGQSIGVSTSASILPKTIQD